MVMENHKVLGFMNSGVLATQQLLVSSQETKKKVNENIICCEVDKSKCMILHSVKC